MRYTVEDICQMAEGQTFDCKSIKIDPKTLATTIVAMANAEMKYLCVEQVLTLKTIFLKFL